MIDLLPLKKRPFEVSVVVTLPVGCKYISIPPYFKAGQNGLLNPDFQVRALLNNKMNDAIMLFGAIAGNINYGKCSLLCDSNVMC